MEAGSGSARLDLRAKLRQRSLAPRLSRIAAGERLDAPVVVELDPTTFCDLACPECISGPLLSQGGFKPDRLRALAHEMAEAGVSAVILIGGGEPLLHPVVGDVIGVLADADIQIGLTTNGTQIHRHIDRIAEQVSWTRVSVDAGSPEVYARFRPSRSKRNVFDAVIRNMRLLSARKRGALGYSYLLMSRRDPDTGAVVDSNFGDVYRAAATARDVGCDYFEVKPAYDMAHRLLPQPSNLIAGLTEQLDAARALETDEFALIHPEHLVDVVSGAPLTQPKEYERCAVAELRTLITPKGAYICPYHRGNPRGRYGDATATSFTELWQGRARQRAMTQIRPDRDCRFHCIRHGSNLDLLGLRGERQVDEFAAAEGHDLFI